MTVMHGTLSSKKMTPINEPEITNLDKWRSRLQAESRLTAFNSFGISGTIPSVPSFGDPRFFEYQLLE